MGEIIDYTKQFIRSGGLGSTRCISIHGKGKNVLLLTHLEDENGKTQFVRRFDGKKASYCLDHRWLSQECGNDKDEAWACVQGNDLTYWQKSEIDIFALNTGKKTLFDMFSLF